jgi:hypothetical protein
MLDRERGGLEARSLIQVVAGLISSIPGSQGPWQLTSLTNSKCGTWVMVTARARGWVSGPPGMNAFWHFCRTLLAASPDATSMYYGSAIAREGP